ncbi:MAG: helix-turn-helix domain-containing protein [Chloroflexi bacterium]|nr:MAG: helix-turn-helix domain-containing protein [Chloroflexota bacterium]
MGPNEVSDFARLITRYRRQRGMSHGQLAQATRLSRTYVYHLETGQRLNPSPHVVQNIARALEMPCNARDQLYKAYTALTGHLVDDTYESMPLDFGELASLLVQNTGYPAHSLDRLWYLHSWNAAVVTLFEIQELMAQEEKVHLLGILFDPILRCHFHGWENLARRLVRDFQYNTRRITHLPEYKVLLKQLRDLPEFRRIAAATSASGKPEPSFIFHVQHSTLGCLALQTAITVSTGIVSHSMVSYVPGDQQTLAIYRRQGWQPHS